MTHSTETHEIGPKDAPELNLDHFDHGSLSQILGVNALSPAIQERNTRLDVLLNPDSSLPVVRLQDITDEDEAANTRAEDGMLVKTYDVHSTKDGHVGMITALVPYGKAALRQGAVAKMSESFVFPEVRGKGYGRSMYLELAKSLPHQIRMTSDELLTESATRCGNGW